MSGLRVEGIVKSFKKKLVVDHLGFEAKEGEFLVLLGPSGCGKTTMLRIIAGLELQDEGKVFIGGREVTNLSPRERNVAMVFQSYALYPHMSVFENMAFPLKMRGISREMIRKRVKSAADLLRIGDLLERRPRELSGGQRQRVAIGRAIVREPSLFLFDEPLSNLDAQLRTGMRVEIKKLHQDLGTTTVYVTHDQTEAMTLADRIVIIKDGKLQQADTPSVIYKRPLNTFVATFIGNPPMNLIDGEVRVEGGGVFFVSTGIRLELPGKDHLEKLDGKPVKLGVRPEQIKTGKGGIKGVLKFVEDLGGEQILHFQVGDAKILVRTTEKEGVRVDDIIGLVFHKESVCMFYRDTLVG
ncbi:MAG: ABC transporter ATP-binding protein [Nitrospirae bacterium]|nr:MAG: ABC transporter ATP-binding protein [Nitrospirota bacterium]